MALGLGWDLVDRVVGVGLGSRVDLGFGGRGHRRSVVVRETRVRAGLLECRLVVRSDLSVGLWRVVAVIVFAVYGGPEIT